jgi:hypothetical protein
MILWAIMRRVSTRIATMALVVVGVVSAAAAAIAGLPEIALGLGALRTVEALTLINKAPEATWKRKR